MPSNHNHNGSDLGLVIAGWVAAYTGIIVLMWLVVTLTR